MDRLVQVVVASLEDDKAEDIVVLDVATRATFADRMVIATGLVERQIQAMAGHVDRALGELGIKRIRTESSPDWVLLDAGDLVVHLFRPEARANYRLEKMWGPDSPVDGPLGEDSTMPPLSDEDAAEIAADMGRTGLDFDDEGMQVEDEDHVSGEDLGEDDLSDDLGDDVIEE
ncbi:ribosome silencing factor [Roseomonas ludipueritiae]|uniref:Ribosomal silencing factor RsfS n=1 Tax=Pseudoroseomonas ludipueritiae TaxID=198093 RepID=A0ABR7RF34_9PROT|nr:ribosome silencing factor [Pseudoroseomonas ludipueritiae]